MERDAITFISNKQHLRPESRADELTAHATRAIISVLAALLGRDFLEHLCYGCTVLSIEIGVDLVKEVKWRGIALLDRKDESKGTQT